MRRRRSRQKPEGTNRKQFLRQKYLGKQARRPVLRSMVSEIKTNVSSSSSSSQKTKKSFKQTKKLLKSTNAKFKSQLKNAMVKLKRVQTLHSINKQTKKKNSDLNLTENNTREISGLANPKPLRRCSKKCVRKSLITDKSSSSVFVVCQKIKHPELSKDSPREDNKITKPRTRSTASNRQLISLTDGQYLLNKQRNISDESAKILEKFDITKSYCVISLKDQVLVNSKTKQAKNVEGVLEIPDQYLDDASVPSRKYGIPSHSLLTSGHNNKSKNSNTRDILKRKAGSRPSLTITAKKMIKNVNQKMNSISVKRKVSTLSESKDLTDDMAIEYKLGKLPKSRKLASQNTSFASKNTWRSRAKESVENTIAKYISDTRPTKPVTSPVAKMSRKVINKARKFQLQNTALKKETHTLPDKTQRKDVPDPSSQSKLLELLSKSEMKFSQEVLEYLFGDCHADHTENIPVKESSKSESVTTLLSHKATKSFQPSTSNYVQKTKPLLISSGVKKKKNKKKMFRGGRYTLNPKKKKRKGKTEDKHYIERGEKIDKVDSCTKDSPNFKSDLLINTATPKNPHLNLSSAGQKLGGSGYVLVRDKSLPPKLFYSGGKPLAIVEGVARKTFTTKSTYTKPQEPVPETVPNNLFNQKEQGEAPQKLHENEVPLKEVHPVPAAVNSSLLLESKKDDLKSSSDKNGKDIEEAMKQTEIDVSSPSLKQMKGYADNDHEHLDLQKDAEDMNEERSSHGLPSPAAEIHYDDVDEGENSQTCICKCTTKPELVYKTYSKTMCQAVDLIDGKLVGCENDMNSCILARSSAAVPLTEMCGVHFWRLKHHQCCPICNVFCTQGKFLRCSAQSSQDEDNSHLFHPKCLPDGDKEKCPHCGNSSDVQRVHLILTDKKLFTSAISSVDKSVNLPLFEENGEIKAQIISACKGVNAEQDIAISSCGISSMVLMKTLAKENSINLRLSDKCFHTAIKCGDAEKLFQMLCNGMNPNVKFPNEKNSSALHIAAASGHMHIVQLLVQAGACVNVRNDRLVIPLMSAIEKGDFRIVKYLIFAGTNVCHQDENGMSSLHYAAKAGNDKVAEFIYEHGHTNVNIQDDGGWTPLVWATEYGHLNIVKWLLDRGADPDVRDKERNVALHWAAFSGDADIADLLLDRGSYIDSVNKINEAPLHIAARKDNYQCVMLFIARGADVNMQSENGTTPLMCCHETSETWRLLKLYYDSQDKTSKEIKCSKVLSKDISRGKEFHPIQVVNEVDKTKFPSNFLYIIQNCESPKVYVNKIVKAMNSCKCKKNCTAQACGCSRLSIKLSYDKSGCLLPDFDMLNPSVIFECNKLCTCHQSCVNRVVQHGTKCLLQVFRTVRKGWGVKTLRNMSKGTFVCEYIGELITDDEADVRSESSYVFDLDSGEDLTYCIDSSSYGNISRFLNHSCEPNLIAVKVFTNHHDTNFPHIAFFSNRDIMANEELCFDYGETFWAVMSKFFLCTCQSPLCKYSANTIDNTLARYFSKLPPPDCPPVSSDTQES